MSFTPPPPPPPPNTVEEKVPPVAWLVPVGALLAVIGAFTPWFKPEVTASGNGRTITKSVDNALYSWRDGKIGLLAPIVLAVVAFGIIGLMRGRTSARFSRGSSGPVVAAARGALIAGAVSLVAVVIAWFVLPSQYKFTEGGRDYSWDDYIKAIKAVPGVDSADIGHGPQIGYWLTIAGAVVVLVGGALMLVMRSKAQPVPGAVSQGGQFGAPPAGGYPPPSAPPSAPQPVPQYGAPQAPQYGAPQAPPAPAAPQAPPAPPQQQGWQQPPAPPQH